MTILPTAWHRVLLGKLSLLLELATYATLAYGTAYYFGLEVDWQQHVIHSRISECRVGGVQGEGQASLPYVPLLWQPSPSTSSPSG